jgi:hypothetical protein
MTSRSSERRIRCVRAGFGCPAVLRHLATLSMLRELANVRHGCLKTRATMAARPLPSAHRYHGMPFGVIVGSMPLHVVEHASQIRQFLTAAGIKVQPMPGDRGYTGDR